MNRIRTMILMLAVGATACGSSGIDKKSPHGAEPDGNVGSTNNGVVTNNGVAPNNGGATNNGGSTNNATTGTNNGSTSTPVVSTCGDGVLDSGEACDGSTSVTCEEMGFDTGTTSCSTECLIELSGCVRFSCGDGVVDEDEACDDGADNGTYGNCNGNCSGLAAHCGDGVANGGEECDGSDLRGSTCSSVGFDAGSLSCDATCDLVTTQCRVSYCGDGVVDSGESCDDGSQNGAYGHCNASCTGLGPRCGDGIVNGSEACDGNQVSASCDDLGLGRGTVGCTNACVHDTSFCSLHPAAGELVITEVMQNPDALYDNDGEWFEIYNTTGRAYDLDGCYVESGTSSGVESFDINRSARISSNDYFTFARSSAPGFTPDYDYAGQINLNNYDDYVKLVCPDPYTGSDKVVDQVDYDEVAFPIPTGASMSLHAFAIDASSNDVGSNWCAATSTFSSGDRGTPGASNASCN